MSEKPNLPEREEYPDATQRAALELIIKLIGTKPGQYPYSDMIVDVDGSLLYYGGCWAGWTCVESLIRQRGFK